MLASSFAGLYVLAALACPVGMGLMMVFMGKGMMGGKRREQPTSDDGESLGALKAEQARLAEKIAALEEPSAREDDDEAPATATAQEAERTPV